MSVQVTTSMVRQYHSTMKLVMQQMESVLRDIVTVEPLVGESGFFDYIGKIVVQQKNTRHSKVTYSDTPHTRRKIFGGEFYAADLIDKGDQVQLLADPASKYNQTFKAAFNTKIDSLIAVAASGTAYSGKDGTTSIALPSGQKIASASVNMTTAKLMAALELFNTNDIPADGYEKWCALGPKQVTALLSEVEYGSSDYNLIRPLSEGKLVKWMGFNFRMSNQLTTDGNSPATRYCPAWIAPGITLAINYDIVAEMSTMPEYHYATQVYMSMFMGASRMEEVDVVEIACYEG